VERCINEGNGDDISLDKVAYEVFNFWFQVAAWTTEIIGIKSYLDFSFTEREQGHFLRRDCSGESEKKQEKNNAENKLYCAFFLMKIYHNHKCIENYLFCKGNITHQTLFITLFIDRNSAVDYI
jgi:hypothetical protein